MADAFKTGFPVNNGLLPTSGVPRALPVDLNFSGSAVLALNLFAELAGNQIDYIQSIYVDNRSNAEALTITETAIGQTISCPANSQGIFPLFMVGVNLVAAKTTIGGTAKIILVSVPLTSSVWSASSSGGGGTLPAQLAGSAWASTSASVGLASASILAANPARKRVLFQSGTANTGEISIRFGGAASASLGVTLFPGGTYTTPGGQTEDPSQVFAISTVAAQTLTVWEM